MFFAMDWQLSWEYLVLSLSSLLDARVWVSPSACVTSSQWSWGWFITSRSPNGTIFLKNLLFLSVSLPVPCTFTSWWSKGLTSTTVPVLCHLLGLSPCWFCTLTLCPTSSPGSDFAPTDNLSSHFLLIIIIHLSSGNRITWNCCCCCCCCCCC